MLHLRLGFRTCRFSRFPRFGRRSGSALVSSCALFRIMSIESLPDQRPDRRMHRTAWISRSRNDFTTPAPSRRRASSGG